MPLVDRVGEETQVFHDVTDEEIFQLQSSTTSTDYQRYLVRMYGFVRPLERSITHTPDLDRHIDLRKFQKCELIRRDLLALHMTSDEIAQLPECAVPSFKTPEEALGWAYPVERSALRHSDVFRHLASILPGEAAFASSYLKCYSGVVGEIWRSFGSALEAFEASPPRAQQVINSAKAAFQCLRAWRFLHAQDRGIPQFAHLGGGPSPSRQPRRWRAVAAARVRTRS
jgi:heme oxygenase (biliverdin-IX-beta and delta-forming)